MRVTALKHGVRPLEFYQKNPADPDWLAKISDFHGHLGPWLVAGAMVGRNALQRLDTPGQWKIEVVCWMPADRHRTPFTCFLDGLQASCGATMGKRNLWLKEMDVLLQAEWPLVRVIRLPDKDRSAAGVSYTATENLHAWMKRVTHERLEEDSRLLSREDIAGLFRIQILEPAQCAMMGYGSGDQNQAAART